MIHTQNLTVRLGEQRVVQDVSIHFSENKTTALIGPSGCGKTTILRSLLGLLQPLEGTIAYSAELQAHSATTLRRKLSYMVQGGGLFPHLTAEENVLLVARLDQMNADWMKDRLKELTQIASLDTTLLSRYPSQLSGGQRQRVSLIRALFLDPPMVLLDEPLGAIDPMIRAEMQVELKDIFSRLRKTVVLVTHDMAEACFFADQIVLMRSGQIVQTGTQQELFHSPVDPFVTRFLRAQHYLPGDSP